MYVVSFSLCCSQVNFSEFDSVALVVAVEWVFFLPGLHFFMLCNWTIFRPYQNRLTDQLHVINAE